MTAVPTFLVAIGFAPELLLSDTTQYDVWVELFKMAGIAVSSAASLVGLILIRRDHRATRRVERKVDRKRHAVRRTDLQGDDPRVTIVEDRRKSRDD